MMSILNPNKALRSLRKTPLILDAILRDVTQEQAQQYTDGPDGWSVLYVMCHIADYEFIYYERMRLMLDTDDPLFPDVSNDELIRAHNYGAQNLREEYRRYAKQRQVLITLLEGLNNDQWARRGTYPTVGEATVLTLAVNVALHDLNHIEQIVHTLPQ
jgi:uncharacterized damage-inducible protein DinB